MKKITASKRFTLDWQDILKGLIMAILFPAFLTIQQSLDAGRWDFDWKNIAMASIAGGVGYLIKNLFSPPTVKITTRTNEDAEDLKNSLK